MIVRYRDRADADVDQISRYIADDSPAAAARFLDSVDSTVNLLLRFPGAGMLVPTRRKNARGLRQITVNDFERYVLYYRLNGELEIVRVLHSARDRDAILDDET